MPGDTTADLQEAIDRLAAGDPAARNELIGRAADRLHRLAGLIIRQSFPAWRGREESIAQESALRLMKALGAVQPPTVRDFFRLAALQVRRSLLDLIALERRPGPSGTSEGQSTDDPARLAEWAEFHHQAGALPEAEREVFALCYYQGLTQADAARVLEQHPRAVSRLWVAALQRLEPFAPGATGLPDAR